MLGACLPEEVTTAVRENIMPTISSLDEARAFSESAVKARKRVNVHLKVDTGMGRLGASPSEVPSLAAAVRSLPGLDLQGVFSHLSSAEDDAEFTAIQIRLFEGVLQQLTDSGIQVPTIHIDNSAGILHQPESIFNLVRPGLLVYGIIPSGKRPLDDSELKRQIQPALSLKCHVSLVKEVSKGAPLSYGHTFIAPRAMRLGALSAGYGDGYMRSGSNKAQVLVNGHRCRVVGRITMDQTLVDLTFAEEVKPGAEAVLIGRQGNEEISATQLADWCGTIPWEVLTNITYRVPRLYRGGQAA
jgi:alanine racemase